MDNREREQLVEAAERNARKRKIRKAVIALSIVAVVAVVFILLCIQGPFDPRGLIKSRYPWLR